MTSPSPASPRHDDISLRAYSIWERTGRPAGNEQEHWYVAERELMQTGVPSLAAEMADDPRPAARPKAKTKR